MGAKQSARKPPSGKGIFLRRFMSGLKAVTYKAFIREPQSGEKQNNKTLRQQALNAVCQFLHAVAFTNHCVGGNPSARERSGDRFGIHGE
jgi:hypothetical protein